MFFSYAAFHLFYERIKAVTFDENFCKTTGINFVAWHYRLMAMVSFFSVASFSSVGLILVLTFLVIPAASSFLFAKTLRGMVYLGFFIGIINSVSGYYLAAWTDTSVSGAIAVVSGVVFFIGLTLKNILSRRVSNNTYEPLTQN
jgi:manganese/zinc/iron transport system permease protein